MGPELEVVVVFSGDALCVCLLSCDSVVADGYSVGKLTSGLALSYYARVLRVDHKLV